MNNSEYRHKNIANNSSLMKYANGSQFEAKASEKPGP